MDNHSKHDIDQVFRERFDGLKDHTADPASQWSAMEGLLQSSMPVASGGAVASGSTGLWAAAANVAAVVAVAGITTMDTPTLPSSQQSLGLDVASSEFRSDEEELPSAVSWEAASQQAVLSVTNSVNEQTGVLEGSVAQSMSTSVKSVEEDGFMPPVQDVAESAFVADRATSELETMDKIALVTEVSGIEERQALDYDYVRIDDPSGGKLFVRAGMRLGNGESNSINNPAQWRVNNVLTIGYSHALSPMTRLTVEVGHLRRSGNGIERAKDVDFSPLMSVISTSYSAVDDSRLANELEHVRESLIATTMDFVHMPIQMHVQLTEHSDASIGFFSDYLIRAKNESYMVYNAKDYINARFGEQDEYTREGLKDIRLGLIGGYQHKISDRFSADIRGMIPITSIYDRKSEFSVYNEPSQLVDFQFSLVYKI